MQYYVIGENGGPVTGSGMTPDATYPPGAIPCDAYVYQNPQLFEIQGGAAVISNARQLQQAKAAKLAEITADYAAATTADIAYMSTTFQADPASINTMAQVLSGSTMGLPADFYWVDAGNVQVPMTLAQLQGLGAMIIERNWDAFKVLQNKKTLLSDAATIEDVNAL